MLLFLAGTTQADEVPVNCLSDHLLEAIEMNSHRRALYAELTDGKSKLLSDIVVNAERAAYFPALYLDHRGRRFARKGLGIFCDYVGTRATAKPFAARFDFEPQHISLYKRPNARRIIRRLQEFKKREDYRGLQQAIRDEIDRLAPYPTFHAMLRHNLRTALRTATLVPVHLKMARERGIRSPKALLHQYLDNGITTVNYGIFIDSIAAKFHAQGVPMIHNDLPQVPDFDVE